jgi:hypothetical protein
LSRLKYNPSLLRFEHEELKQVVMGKFRFALTAALGIALSGQLAAAATPEFQITPRAGVGSLRVDALAGVNDGSVSTNTYGIGASFGYLTPIGIVAEIGADSFGDFDWFNAVDSFSLTQEFVSLGYQAELGNGWRLVPKAGRSRWKLESEEGQLLNPGPEEAREKKGYNYFWELSLSRRISSVVTLGVVHKQGQYEFGRTRSTAFLVTLGF